MHHKYVCGIVLLVLSGTFLPRSAAAYYSPRQGRWLSRDPIGEKGGLNLQAFVHNRPVNHYDRLGLYGHSDQCYEACVATGHDPKYCERVCSTGGGSAGDDCGIEIHQSPFCLIGGGNGGQLGHTWLTWGGGETGEVADCPANYINGQKSKCQKRYINNKWKTISVDSGTFRVGDQTRSCASANCEAIKDCLIQQMTELCPPGSFDLKNNNCRQFVDRAMSNCCLKKGPLFYVDWLAPIRYCCSSCAKHNTGV